MHAGMTPHRAWQTQPRMRETDSREERQESVLTDWGASRERSGAERRGDKDPDPTPHCQPLSAGRDRPASLSPALHTRQRMFGVTASASGTPSQQALKSLCPRYLDRLFLVCSAAGASHIRTSHSGCNADTICPGLCETLHKMTQVWASAR